MAKPSPTPPTPNPAPPPPRPANRHAHFAIIAIALTLLSWALYLLTLFVTLTVPLPESRHPHLPIATRWFTIEAGVIRIFEFDRWEFIFWGEPPSEEEFCPSDRFTLRLHGFTKPALWNFERSPYPFNDSRGSLTTIPLWPILLLVSIPAALITHRFLRTTRRLHIHACLFCGYKLANLPSPTCPECGNKP